MLLDALPEPTPLAQLSRREGEMRYVTQHFSDLQGLKWSPFWAGLLISFYVPHGFYVPHDRVHQRIAMSAFGAVIVLSAACAWRMKRWYKDRYGFVGAAKTPPEQSRGAGLLMLLCLPCMFVLAVSRRDVSIYVSLVLMTQTYLLPKCAACPRSGPVRLRQLLYRVVATASLSISVYAAISPISGKLAFILWLWSLLLLGLYDHWLLGFLLRPRYTGLAEASHD